MSRNRSRKGITLTEMLVVIAVIAVLAALIALFLARNLNRSRAALNGANLRAARALLAMELLADPGNPDEVMDRVLATAPKSAGVDLPGLSIPDGTPMDAVITEDGVDTVYGDYDEEDFEEVLENGILEEDPTRETGDDSGGATQIVFCKVLTCFSSDLVDGLYCADHQIKICEKSLKQGDQLVPCGKEYRERCDGDHYKSIQCLCTATGSQKKPCGNCGHWHYRFDCTATVLVPENEAQ